MGTSVLCRGTGWPIPSWCVEVECNRISLVWVFVIMYVLCCNSIQCHEKLKFSQVGTSMTVGHELHPALSSGLYCIAMLFDYPLHAELHHYIIAWLTATANHMDLSFFIARSKATIPL